MAKFATSNGRRAWPVRMLNRFIGIKDDESAPRTREQTGRQGVATGGLGFGGGAISALGSTHRFQLYRDIMRNPSIALARMVSRAPIKAAAWTYEKANDDVPDDHVALVQSTLDPIRRGLLHDMFFGVDFGYAPFEKVWKVDEITGQQTYSRLKPLMVDITRIMVDKTTGAFGGLKNKDAVLDERHSFLFTNDPLFGDLHGQPRTENVKFEYRKWLDACVELGKYLQLSANPRPVVRYVPGQSDDQGGSREDNFDLAKRFLDQLAQGVGVAFPMEFAPWAETFINGGIDPSELMAWKVSFLETKSSRVKDFLEPMRHWERLLFRGYLVPERTATEGETGTKAEAATQADIAVLGAEELKTDMMECVNLGLVDDLLVVNFGREARSGVRAVASPLVDKQKEFFKRIIEKLLASPIGPDLFLNAVDEIALFEQGGLPIDAARQAGDRAGVVPDPDEVARMIEKAAANKPSEDE